MIELEWLVGHIFFSEIIGAGGIDIFPEKQESDHHLLHDFNMGAQRIVELEVLVIPYHVVHPLVVEQDLVFVAFVELGVDLVGPVVGAIFNLFELQLLDVELMEQVGDLVQIMILEDLRNEFLIGGLIMFRLVAAIFDYDGFILRWIWILSISLIVKTPNPVDFGGILAIFYCANIAPPVLAAGLGGLFLIGNVIVY